MSSTVFVICCSNTSIHSIKEEKPTVETMLVNPATCIALRTGIEVNRRHIQQRFYFHKATAHRHCMWKLLILRSSNITR